MLTLTHYEHLNFVQHPADNTSLMQSDGNSFIGDVVLETFNMSYRDKDSMLDQKYKKKIFCALYYKDLKFLKGMKKIDI